MQSPERIEWPAGLVVFSADGTAQFGWQNPETGAFYAEDDGHCIVDAVAGVAWSAGSIQ
jgi:hypothetical protein